MARRFIVSENDIEFIDEKKFKIYGTEVKHIQVLRHKISDKIIINEYICCIEIMTKDSMELKIIDKAQKLGEPHYILTLYQAYLKSDKMDFVVQKQVELGVSKIVPFVSKNTVVKLNEKDIVKKQERLQKIADEACKQCGRTDKVEVRSTINFSSILNEVTLYDMVIFAYEKETNSLREVIESAKSKELKNIAIIIGAEGGFTEDEAEILSRTEKIKTVSLGERILRAETASIYLSSVIAYEMK